MFSLLGGVFSAIVNIAQGWFKHRAAKTEATRDVQLASIRAQVDIQTGSFKDEYLVILWTAPLIPALLDSIIHWDPSMTTFLTVVGALPLWYTSLLITITGASFGVRSLQNWKSSKLDREIRWGNHEEVVRKNGNGNGPTAASSGLPPPMVEQRG